MNLFKVLIEIKNENILQQVDQEVSLMFKTNPPSSMEKFLDEINRICLKHKVRYSQYMDWLKINGPKLNENKNKRK